jgi:hypothetical protein
VGKNATLSQQTVDAVTNSMAIIGF